MTQDVYNVGKKLSNTIKYTKDTLKDYVISFNIRTFCEDILNTEVIDISEEDRHKILTLIENLSI